MSLDGTTSGTLQEPTAAFNAGVNPTSALPLPGTGDTDVNPPGGSTKSGNFFFAEVGSSADFTINGADSGYNTMYVADANNSSSGDLAGITKYSWNGTGWNTDGTIGNGTPGIE